MEIEPKKAKTIKKVNTMLKLVKFLYGDTLNTLTKDVNKFIQSEVSELHDVRVISAGRDFFITVIYSPLETTGEPSTKAEE